MAAHWETLLLALESRDYELATTTLLSELGCDGPAQLLPLLAGLLAETVRREDEAEMQRKTARAKKGSAFGRFTAADAGGVAAKIEEGMREAAAAADTRDFASTALRRRRRTLRVVFDADAAASAVSELLAAYRSEAFASEARNVNNSWAATGKPCAERLSDIEGACFRVAMRPLLLRYGFTADLEGSTEMRARVDELANSCKGLMELKREMNKVVLRSFPNVYDKPLGGD